MKKSKHAKSHLSPEEKAFGKQQIYILVGMIVIGLAFGLYYMQ